MYAIKTDHRKPGQLPYVHVYVEEDGVLEEQGEVADLSLHIATKRLIEDGNALAYVPIADASAVELRQALEQLCGSDSATTFRVVGS